MGGSAASIRTKRTRWSFSSTTCLAVVLLSLAISSSFLTVLLLPFVPNGVVSQDVFRLFNYSAGSAASGRQESLSCHPTHSENCVRHLSSKIKRAYPKRMDRAWCINQENLTVSSESAFVDSEGRYRGILLVKNPKAASSTSAGVAIRISRRFNCQAIQWQHRMAYLYSNRSTVNGASFMFSTIRDPGARAVSSVFFHLISRSNNEPTDDIILNYLRTRTDKHYGSRSNGQGGFQLRYLAMEEIPEFSAWNGTIDPTRVLNPHQVYQNVQHTINEYDFILVTERMDESLVCLALLLGIDVGSVIVTSSKVAGKNYHLGKPAGKPLICVPTVRSFVSPAVHSYLQSDEWRAANFGDYLLYQAANASLDYTIENVIGRESFESTFSEYKRLKSLEAKECAPHVKFPCTNDGEPQPAVAKTNCYLRMYDFGCGYPCLDQLLEKEGV